jgi:peptidyl-prolyl cis-trans isomerase SurA
MMPRRFTFGTATLALASLAALSAHAQNAPDDGLDLRFANGIAAIVESKVITVDDIRREIQPLIPQIQSDSRNEKEFNEKLEALQDDVIQNLIDRELIVKDFRKDEKKHIPDSFIDNRISEIQAEQFDNDRSKFLAYLRQRGTTLRDYRKEVAEEIILGYMKSQQRKSQSIVSPVKIETFYNENKDRFYQEDRAHMRMLQLTRNPGETDDELKARLNSIGDKFKTGEKFEDLARSFSQEPSRRSKGGDWGWQKRSDLKKEFSEPLFALKTGEMTEPLLLPEAGYLLYVDEREYAGIEPIDKVRDQIERILVQKMATLSQEHWLERLRRNGYVKHY